MISLKKFEIIPDIDCLENINLGQHTTTKLEIYGSLIIVKSIDALAQILEICSNANVEYHVLGWGANQIITRADKVFLKLKFDFDLTFFDKVRDEYILPASIGLNVLTGHALKFGLKDWDALTGIPASLGGAIYMNAGTNLGEIRSIVKWVDLMTTSGKVRREVMNENSFSYRKNNFVKPNEIIVQACLKNNGLDSKIPEKIKEYHDLRKRTQPLTTANCGCIFKNYSPEMRAGKCIDDLGLKGFEMNGVRVSPIHANFFENCGKATPSDYVKLMKHVQDELLKHYGILFEFEVKVY